VKLNTSTSSIEIKAPAHKVWEALTRPELVKLWQYGSVLTTTWALGSPIHFGAEWNGQVFAQWGQVLEFIPDTRLKYSLYAPRPDLADSPENYFYMTYQLDEEGGKTKLTIIQDDPRPRAQSETAEDQEENSILLGLKALIEKS
jgi:uncharacterized protein YndB with AHSA1/START domain